MITSAAAACGAAGAICASFAGTTGYRLAHSRPWAGGRSTCSSCLRTLNYWDTLPIVGFAAARGRCRHCAAPIPLWHLATEVFGLLALPVMIDIFGVLPGVVLFALGLVLIASSVSDFESQILPDGLILMTAVCALAMALIEGRNHLLVGIVSAALTAVVLELLRRFIRTRSGQPGLGLGDVKLAAALAIWLGVQIPLVMAVASGLGTAVILVGGRTFERIAFGPYISVSAFTIGVVELVIQGDPWLALK